MGNYELGSLFGLRMTLRAQAFVGTLVLWALFAAIARFVLRLPAGEALLGGLLATVLHWLSEIAHHLGHAVAARRTGYPMSGIRLGFLGVLASSVYPRNEPELPPALHIQRALGGPLASLLIGLVAGALALALRSSGGLAWWLALFVCVENIVVFGLQVFVPLGFNDASTVLHWWRQRVATPPVRR
jgi:hypothetical protein